MLHTSARRLSSSLTATVLAGVLLAGCGGEPEAVPEAPPTPIASLDTVSMQVPRIEFCPSVPPAAVSDALGGKPDDEAAYGNGDEAELPDVGSDVLHELGCSWSRDEGTTARAWIFARPVDEGFARSVVVSAGKTKACQVASGPEFGKPSVTQVCSFPDGGHRVRHAGLFGQSWLTCEVAAPASELPDLRKRADDWCVAVLGALSTAP